MKGSFSKDLESVLAKTSTSGVAYSRANVQPDHTELDIMVVDDEYRLNCGKPWITFEIDTFSRMVMGFHISLDPPGNTGEEHE